MSPSAVESLGCVGVLRGNVSLLHKDKMMPIPTAFSSQMSALLILMLFMQLTLFICKVTVARSSMSQTMQIGYGGRINTAEYPVRVSHKQIIMYDTVCAKSVRVSGK